MRTRRRGQEKGVTRTKEHRRRFGALESKRTYDMSRKFMLRSDVEYNTVGQKPKTKRPPFEKLLDAILAGYKPELVEGELEVDIYRLLNEQGLKDETTDCGETPLIAAITHFDKPSQVSVVYELLCRRADPNTRSTAVAGMRSVSPLVAACEMHSLEEAGAGTGPEEAHLRSESLVKALLAFKANPNERLSDGRTLSHHVAISPGNRRREIMAALVWYGADVNAQDEYGESPLFVAASLGDGEGARALLEAGAYLDDLLASGTERGQDRWSRLFTEAQRTRWVGRTEEEKRRCDEVMTEALREYNTKGSHKAMTPEDWAQIAADSPSYHEER